MKILFVCLGNICRSQAAEAIFAELIERHGAEGIAVDSAGIMDYHEGERADARMEKALRQKGYHSRTPSRPVKAKDFETFDLIFAMDEANRRALKAKCPKAEDVQKIRLTADYLTAHEAREIPDPYYGTAEDFEYVVQLLEDACAEIYKTHVTPADR